MTDTLKIRRRGETQVREVDPDSAAGLAELERRARRHLEERKQAHGQATDQVERMRRALDQAETTLAAITAELDDADREHIAAEALAAEAKGPADNGS